MNSQTKRSIKWIVFILIVIIILNALTPFYANRKGPDYNYQAFEKLEDNPDILMFGSSLMEYAINPNQLYEEYGYTSYNLAGHSQRLDTTYFVMDTALKQKNPKVVFIVTDYINEITDSNTLNDEILSVRDLKGNELQKWKYLYHHFGYRVMEYIKFFFPVFQFHSQLLENDIDNQYHDEHVYRDLLYKKGYETVKSHKSIQIGQNAVNQEPLSQEAIAYINGMLELCDRKEIQVVFVTVPNIDDFKYDSAIKENFPERGYINFYDLIDEIGLDGTNDYLDQYHLNKHGGKKVTEYVGHYLQEHYNLVNHKELNEDNIWDRTLRAKSKMKDDIFDAEVWKEEYTK